MSDRPEEGEHPKAARHHELIRRFTAKLASDLDLGRVFAPAMHELRAEFGFDEAAVLVIDDANRELRPFAGTMPPPPGFRVPLPHIDTASARALAGGKTVRVDDTEQGAFAFDAFLREAGFRAHLAHPLRGNERLLGTLNLASRRKGGLERVPDALLESVAATLAIALQNALLFDRVRASEQRYSSLVEGDPDCIYRLDHEGRLLFVNQAGARLLGLPGAALPGRPLLDFVHPEDARPDLFAPLTSGRVEQLVLDLRLVNASGGVIATSHHVHVLHDGDGRLAALQGRARDQTRAREAERALRRHQELVEALDDFVFMADTSGRLLLINRKARETLGWELDQVGGMTIWDLHPPEDRARVERERWRIVETGASTFEVRLLARSGTTIPTRVRVSYSPASGTFQGVYRDVTEERLMQERLLQVERLRALGEMASGVAHTFNNLLAVIGTTTQVARSLEPGPRLQAELEAIQQAVRDGGAAVRRVQDFTRKRPAELHHDLDLNSIVEEVAHLTRPRARAAGVTIATALAPLPPVRGSEAEIKDVLLNLLFNALDALPGPGQITLRSARRDRGEVAVEVQDNGRGMTAEVRGRIFTPFYSTKGERGSGLGLAIALNVVAQHGGSIEVESEPGAGTTMRVLLPEAPAAGRRPLRPARVLVVETEPLLRIQLSRAVAAAGHVVDAVTTAEEALALLDDTFDCVFTDLALPGASGLTVVDRAKALGARGILLAGWGDEVTEEKVREHQVDAVVRKPFPVDAVLNLIQVPAPPRGD